MHCLSDSPGVRLHLPRCTWTRSWAGPMEPLESWWGDHRLSWEVYRVFLETPHSPSVGWGDLLPQTLHLRMMLSLWHSRNCVCRAEVSTVAGATADQAQWGPGTLRTSCHHLCSESWQRPGNPRQEASDRASPAAPTKGTGPGHLTAGRWEVGTASEPPGPGSTPRALLLP